MTSPTTSPALATYQPLPFEVPRFADQDRANAGVAAILSAIVDGDEFIAVATGYVAVVAAGQVFEHRQYVGHFDSGWQLAVVREDVVTKGGLRFAVGDFVLARCEPSPLPTVFPAQWSAWSLRGAVECSIHPSVVEVL